MKMYAGSMLAQQVYGDVISTDHCPIFFAAKNQHAAEKWLMEYAKKEHFLPRQGWINHSVSVVETIVEATE